MASEILGYKEPVWKSALRSVGKRAAQTLWPIIPNSLYIKTGTLNIALTRICNARCVFCPIDLVPRQDKSHMKDEVFQRILDSLPGTHFRRIHLSPDVGEPLLAPGFIEKVHALRNAGIEFVEVTTNGTFLDRVGIDAMVADHGPDEINISFPGFDEAMYERVYRTKKYQLTRDNILTLLRTNARQARPKNIQLWLRGDKPIEEVMAAPEMAEVKELASAIT